MSIKIGTSDVTDIKIGTTNVNTVYIGSTVIWQRGSVYSYALSLGLTYSTGTYILASGERTATLTVTRRTYINSVYQSELDALVDADSIVFTYEPSGCDFSATRTSLGTYTISAASRGTVPSAETDSTIRVNYTPPSSSQIYETTTVKQEANAVIDTEYDTSAVFVINSSYTNEAYPAPASGDGWIVTATATIRNYENYQYTSLDWTGFVQVGNDTHVPQSEIGISVSGGLYDGGGSGSGANISWPSMGTTEYEDGRSGIITATYSSYSDGIAVYQEANIVEPATLIRTIHLYLDGYEDDIMGVDFEGDTISVSATGSASGYYTSGSAYSGSFSPTISEQASWLSISGGTITVAYNSGAERSADITASYVGATSVVLSITQDEVADSPSVSRGTPNASSTQIQFVGVITDNGGDDITACGFNWGASSGSLTNLIGADSVVQSGNFTKTISGLTPSTTYYWNAWATNGAGTTTTSEGSVSTLGIVSGSITAAQFQFGYTKADVTLVIDNDTAGQVNLGVISCTIKDGSTTVGSSSFNLGNNVVINAGATFNGSVSVTTSGVNQSHTHIAYTSSIPQGVGVLQRTVTPPDI